MPMVNDEDYTLLEEISNPLFQRIDAGTPLSDFPWPARVLVLIMSAQGILDNGGLVYFFENDWPGNSPSSLFEDAYRTIGADTVADAIAATAPAFELPEPHRDCPARRAWLDQHRED